MTVFWIIVALLDGPTSEAADSTPTPVDTDHDEVPEDSNATYIPLRSVNAVAAHVPFIEDARTKVTAEMQAMVLTGLTTLVSHYRLTFSLSPPSKSIYSEPSFIIYVTTNSFQSPRLAFACAKPRS